MKYILCYGDSNTWGCVPEKFSRYDFYDRWTGIMEGLLDSEYRVYENALNGRTTVFHDSIEEGRNGRENFEVTLMSNAPLDVVIISLGVNDVKNRFNMQPWDIGWGMDLLVNLVKKSGCGCNGESPKIVIVSPCHIGESWGTSLHGTVFSDESRQKIKQLADIYRFIAERNNCEFVDAARYVTGEGDGIHLSQQSHKILGEVMAELVKKMCP